MSYLDFIDNYYQKCLSIPEKYSIKIKNFINFAFSFKKGFFKLIKTELTWEKVIKKQEEVKLFLVLMV
jgi:hypothetical protein